MKVLGHDICLHIEHDQLVGLELNEATQDTGSNLEMLVEQQIIEYEKGLRKQFDIPITLKGTEFQIKVWKALLLIPFGETRSYSDIAKTIGHPKAIRAVGGACHHNPIGLIVPCHRVIGQNGKLTGYYGGLDLKEELLRHEKTVV